MQVFYAALAALAVTMIGAGVCGVWKIYGKLTEVSTKLDLTIARIDRREDDVDRRLASIEAHTAPRNLKGVPQ